jgi:UDP-glucose 4-epimerase
MLPLMPHHDMKVQGHSLASMPFRRQHQKVRWSQAVQLAASRCQVLGWKTKLDVKDMCRDQWAWATKHPKGFED